MTQTQSDFTAPAAAPADPGSESSGLRKPHVSTGDKVVGGVSHTIMIIWSLLVVVPLLWVIMSSFKTSSEIFASPFALPAKLNFINYANAWTTAGIGSFFFNSVIVVFGA
jgi:N-acetylglucosamine transport system permease protein